MFIEMETQLQECDWQGFPKICALQNYVKSPYSFEVGEASMIWISLKQRLAKPASRKKAVMPSDESGILLQAGCELLIQPHQGCWGYILGGGIEILY